MSEAERRRARAELCSGCWMLISFLLFVAHGKNFHLTLAAVARAHADSLWCRFVCVTVTLTVVSSEILTCLCVYVRCQMSWSLCAWVCREMQKNLINKIKYWTRFCFGKDFLNSHFRTETRVTDRWNQAAKQRNWQRFLKTFVLYWI